MKTFLTSVIVVCTVCVTSMYSQWHEANNGLNGGGINAIAVHNNIIFAGGVSGGFYRSIDTGRTWIPINKGLPFGTIQAITTSGNNIIVCNWGIYLSNDDGNSWRLVGLKDTAVSSMVSSGNTIYAGTNRYGSYISRDKGLTWAKCSDNGLASPSIQEIGLNGSGLFAATYGGGIFQSTDFGENWTEQNSGLVNMQLASVSVYGDTLFTVDYDHTSYISIDNGKNWEQITSLPSLNYTTKKIIKNNDSLFAISSNNIFMCSDKFVPSDNSVSWVARSKGIRNLRSLKLVALGTILIAGTTDFDGGGVYFSADNGKAWVESINGIHHTTVSSISINSDDIYVGTLGHGIFSSPDNGKLWTKSKKSWGGIERVRKCLALGDTIYAGTESQGLFISTDKGNSWANDKYNNFSFGNIISAIAHDANTLYIGTARSGSGVYISNDGGDTWAEKKSGLSSTREISSICANGDTLLVGCYDGVYLSTNKGDTWGLKNKGIENVVVNTIVRKGNEIWIGTDSTGIFVSTDEGNTWTAKNRGLTSTWIHSILISGGTMFAAAKDEVVSENNMWVFIPGGVFCSINNGETWKPITSDLPLTDISSIAIKDKILYAGLKYHGLYNASVNEFNLVSVEKEHASQDEISLFPNPSTGNLMVQLPNSFEPTTIKIFDMVGTEIQNCDVPRGENKIHLNVVNFMPGIYVVKINSFYQRFIKY